MLDAEMLCFSGGFCSDPCHQPLVTLIRAWHFHGEDVFSFEKGGQNDAALPCRLSDDTDAKKTRTGAEVRIISQRGQIVLETHSSTHIRGQTEGIRSGKLLIVS